ncbi:hypothetical protein Z949_3380 [Sulfitobacter guttiformis KCTC 32187]|nr:hypothetical protein Z949_3380 [Sulfitobacter guttiformis KCTC 32187]
MFDGRSQNFSPEYITVEQRFNRVEKGGVFPNNDSDGRRIFLMRHVAQPYGSKACVAQSIGRE